MTLPPKLVFEADQDFAAAQQRVDSLITDLAADLRRRPERSDALPWKGAVLFMLEQIGPTADADYMERLVEMWTAACYRLARAKLTKEES